MDQRRAYVISAAGGMGNYGKNTTVGNVMPNTEQVPCLQLRMHNAVISGHGNQTGGDQW